MESSIEEFGLFSIFEFLLFKSNQGVAYGRAVRLYYTGISHLAGIRSHP